MGAAGVLLAGFGLQHGAAFCYLAGELIVGAGPIGQLLVFQVQNAGDGAVQQAAVVADDQHRMRIFLQIAFQPERAFKVEVVGGFVQQQVIGLRKQHPRQRHPHPPAAREIRTGAQLRLGVKAKTLENAGGAPLGRPGVDIRQAVLNFSDAVRIVRGFRLGHQGGALGVGGQHRIEQRGR
ncbi:MAG: hypothetical protein ACD_54C01282G0006 [uncultured bacterium]|nr:MAG: hypothetical protein ACD_54C01282G0006 [uncultured bacterium]